MIYEIELFNIAIVFIVAYVSACFTYFIDFCIGEPHHGEVEQGRIFSEYGNFILKKYFDVQSDKIKNNSTRLNWWKALGVCPICMNVYVTLLAGILICLFFGTSFWGILPEIFISNRYLRKFMQI